MMRKTVGRLLGWKLAGEQRGGVALFMLLAFMVLAVPLVLAATQVAGQLARNSQVYESRLAESYADASDVEYAISEILNPEAVGIPDILAIPGVLDRDGDGPDVKVYKVTPDIDLLGQGLVVTQEVEYTTPVSEETTFTYTLTVKNEGDSIAILEEVVNYLPPGISYKSGTTIPGVAFATDPDISDIGDPQGIENGGERCGEAPQQLAWRFFWGTPPPTSDSVEHASADPHIHLLPQYKVTLRFDATWTGVSPPVNGNTYYNRATVDYWAPWDDFGAPIEVSTPYGAEFLVDEDDESGQACGFDLVALVDDTVVAPDLLGVEIDVDYTINIRNVSGEELKLERVYDTLPPGFCYKPNSSVWNPLTPGPEPSSVEDCLSGRSQLTWTLEPSYFMSPDETVILTFVARGVVQAGVSYFNDVSAVFTSTGQNGKADIVLALDNRLSICDGVILECPQNGEIELAILKQASSEIVDRFLTEADEGNIRFGVTRFRGCSVSVAEMASDANLLKDGVGATVSGATLSGDVDSTEDKLQANMNDLLAEGKTIKIDGEQIYLRKIGNNLEVVRGLNGTAAVPHSDGANILMFDSEGCETTGNGGGAELNEPAGITATNTTFTVSQLGDLAEGQTIIVDGEHMEVLSIVGNDLTVRRGEDLTTPVAHLDKAPVSIFHQGPDLGINNIQPGFDLASGTNLVAALYGAEAQFKSGEGERPGVPKSIIMISSFTDNSGATDAAIKLAAAEINAEIFAVGVESVGLNKNSQADVATDPDLEHMFTATNFEDLLFRIQEIIDRIPVLVTATGGTSSATAVSGGTLYDIESVDGENSGLQSRVLLRKGAVEILSWQEK